MNMVPDPNLSNSFPEAEIIQRNVKYPRIELKTGRLVLILPESKYFGEDIIQRHSEWIRQKQGEISKAYELASALQLVTDRSREEFKDLLKKVKEENERILHLTVNDILYRRMKTKWASFSSRNNITVNPIMQLLPERIVKYIIFHETAHSMEKRHSAKFWEIIRREYPDADIIERDLFAYWFKVTAFQTDGSDRTW